jgi:hypothetical protein
MAAIWPKLGFADVPLLFMSISFASTLLLSAMQSIAQCHYGTNSYLIVDLWTAIQWPIPLQTAMDSDPAATFYLCNAPCGVDMAKIGFC